MISLCERLDWLRAGRSGDRIPVGGDIFRTCSDWPWGPPSLLYNGYRVFPGVKSGRSVTLTPHPLLVQWSRKGRAIPLLPLWAVRPIQSLRACTRMLFTLCESLPGLYNVYVCRMTPTLRINVSLSSALKDLRYGRREAK